MMVRLVHFYVLVIFLNIAIEYITAQDKGYIATFPSSVLPGSNAPLCIRFFNVKRNIILNIEDDLPHLFEPIKVTVSPTIEKCISLKINRNVTLSNNQKILLIHGISSDGKYEFNNSKTFTIKSAAPLTFIETDKPAYKPGQTVRIRILSIDYLLKPVDKVYSEVYVKDSSDSRVYQWLDLSSNTGLVDLKLPISDEPNLGIWTVTVKDATKEIVATAKFEIKKYVLPKFDLQLQTQKYVSIADKELDFTACAKYSYGKDVKGEISLEFYVKSYFTYAQTKPTFTLKQKMKGCEAISILLADIGFLSENYLYEILIRAVFTEDDTGLNANAESSLDVVYQLHKIILANPEYYKPGLPIEVKIQINDYNDNPVNDEATEIKIIDANNNLISQDNYRSNKDGFIKINFEIPSCIDETNCTKSPVLNINVNINETIDESLPYYKRPYPSSTTFSLTPWFSNGNTYLQIYQSAVTEPISCGDEIKLDIKIKSKNKISGKIYFQIQSRSSALYAGSYNVDEMETKIIIGDKTSINFKQIQLGSFIMTIKVNEVLSPEFTLLVFYIVNGEVIPDSASFQVEKCSKNKVKLALSSNSVKTGEEVKINLSGAPKSLCALSAIDKSVTFMGDRNSIDLDKVFNDLAQFNLDTDYYNNYPSTETCNSFFPFVPFEEVKIKRSLSKKRSLFPYYGFGYYDAYDTYEAFRSSKLIVMSDLTIFKPCNNFYGPIFELNRPVEDAANPPLPQANAESTNNPTNLVRSFFPETWLWSIEILSSKGVKDLTQKAPDSITDWIFNAYCLSKDKGLGIAPTVTLNVFQPFFVSINLPYSVIQGEIFPIQASVFNYLDKCIPVLIEFSSQSRISLVTSNSTKQCVCPDDKLSHLFQAKALEFDTQNGVNITIKVNSLNSFSQIFLKTNKANVKATALQDSSICPASVGEIANIQYSDAEIRPVLVEPEGISVEVVRSSLFVLNTSSTNEEFQVTLPQNIVSNSSRAYLTVIGDPMGPALDNLNNLVALPIGCGEQNMVIFAPLVYVTQYLRDTSQLSTKILNLAQQYLVIGYQRQLTYRHPDGSFSAFGVSDTYGGGTWLTSFVLRCFSQSFELREIIKIDQLDIDKSFNWLLGIQNQDGSFPNLGKLFHTDMAGGLSDFKTSGLTAYVLISLLSALKYTNIQNYNQAQINNAILYLKSAVYNNLNNSDTYTLALTLYAFKLANENPSVLQDIENELDNRAVNQNGLKYWKQDVTDTNTNFFGYYKPRTADIEITAYMLLSKLYGFDRANAANVIIIVKWLNSQRNSLGGFCSTQDTVIALDALSKFARVFYSNQINILISYQFNGINYPSISIDNSNRLLSQKFQIRAFKENSLNTLKFLVNGTGSGLVQFSVRYNIKQETKPKRDFELEILVTNVSACSEASLRINTQYIGDGNVSAMAIVSLRLPSGWLPVEDSISKLTSDSTVDLKRYEINENKIALYFDEIAKSGISFGFEIFKAFDIQNTKPGTIAVYDYYETQDNSLNQEFTISC